MFANDVNGAPRLGRAHPKAQPLNPALAALAVGLALVGCASPGNPGSGQPTAAGTPTASTPDADAQARAASGVDRMPEEQNVTPYFTLSSATGIDGDVKVPYFTFRAKASYTYDAQGRLTRVAKNDPQDEGFMPLDAPPSADLACRPWGAAYNQRRSWHPSTGVFVAGGEVTAAQGAQPVRLLPLDQRNEHGLLFNATPVHGQTAWWAPCIAQKPGVGYQATRFLAGGDRLTLRGTDGRRVTVQLPTEQAPYLMLGTGDPQRDGMGVVPMRIAIVAVDTQRRHLSVQWEATTPQIALDNVSYFTVPTAAQLRTPDFAPLRAMYARTAAHLARCAAPTQPIEDCAWPKRFMPLADLADPRSEPAPRPPATRRR